MVNNEGEMIESFIRYNYNFFDHMVIIDNGCTDNTIDIIQSLISEGYKIHVFNESLESYNQFRLDNKYIKKILNEIVPDIIIPLDADEFLSGIDNPRSLLENLSLDRIYYITWRWYVLSDKDDVTEAFIPKRLLYSLDKPPYNQIDGSEVTKVIIPAKYFSEMKLTLSAGHHTVFGKSNPKIEKIKQLFIAHYRIISDTHLTSKLMCYVMRGIVSMELTTKQTSHRTNQLAIIERGGSLLETAIDVSYSGYPKNVIYNPLNLSFCEPESIKLKYSISSEDSLIQSVLHTGQEMAIRTYNLERKHKEKPYLKPIILWLDGFTESDIFVPNPSNRSILLTSMYNVRGYVTEINELKFLKVNYRLLITPEWLKFLPYKYIVVPNGVEVNDVKTKLEPYIINKEIIISEREYLQKIGPFLMIWSLILFIPSLLCTGLSYTKKNGIKKTINSIRNRLSVKQDK
nr:glycosyltransferase family 2 protein [Oceanispirochaeta crateris]